MATYTDSLRAFAIELFKINAIKFGEFKTKVGVMTPIYCDLRVLVSHPKTMGVLADLIVESLNCSKYEIICGVPYTALPIATIVSYKSGLPMVMRRKEAKDYGTKKLIEGDYKDNDRCLIVEDVVTSGGSILETVKDLVEAGINVREAVVILNREQGGEQILRENGIEMRALFSMTELIKFLYDGKCIDDATRSKVLDYLGRTQIQAKPPVPKHDRLKMRFEDRIAHSNNSLSKQIFRIMSEKKTNLCVAADLSDPTKILNLAEEIGPHICILKTHCDIINSFNDNFVTCLGSIAKKHNFLLFEDRKFADIGKTVELQYSEGVFQLSTWAPLITAHSLSGPSILDALKQSTRNDIGVFLLAEISAKGNLIDEKYTNATITMGLQHSEIITGFVCQRALFVNEPGFIQLTPGVRINVADDGLGQQYNSPESVMHSQGADVAVVGRGITTAENPAEIAMKYKTLLWDAYVKRLSHE